MNGIHPIQKMDQLDVVPVDTHVWQIACRDYKDKFIPENNNKTLTKKVRTILPRVLLLHLSLFPNTVGFSTNLQMYEEVGSFFRELFGPLTGWAHTVLFTADLANFQHYLPEDLR